MHKFGSLLLAVLLLGLGGCKPPSSNTEKATPDIALRADAQIIEWKLATSWPKNFPGLGMAPERFARLVDEMSNGRLKITVYGAGELMPAFAVLMA